jgi:hypothetical protein
MKKFALPVVFLLLCGFASVRADEGFTGTWDTTFGPVTMIQKGKKVIGAYYENKASLEGKAENGKLTFNYQEEAEGGEGEFVLSDDGKTFAGRYRVVGTKNWIDWKGTRRLPPP